MILTSFLLGSGAISALQKCEVPLPAQSSTKNPNNTKTLQAHILIILPQNFPPACEAELSYAFHKDLRLIIRKIMRDHLVNSIHHINALH